MAVRFDHLPRAGILRILLCLVLLLFGSQCSHLTKFAPRSKERPAKRSPSTNAEQADEEEEASEDPEKHRLVARDDTPFFRWLRTGLKEGATPSRYLDANTKVELLEESEENTFSRVRLATKEKGWVPSRLLAPLPAPEVEVEAGGDTATGADPSTETSNPPGTSDPAVPPLGHESPDPGPIDPSAIPEIHIPEVGVDVQSDG